MSGDAVRAGREELAPDLREALRTFRLPPADVLRRWIVRVGGGEGDAVLLVSVFGRLPPARCEGLSDEDPVPPLQHPGAEIREAAMERLGAGIGSEATGRGPVAESP